MPWKPITRAAATSRPCASKKIVPGGPNRLKRFRLFGPPGTIFFDATGNEIRAARLIGYQNSRGFLDTLRSAGL